ncbi:MAG: hypothetical protein OXE50_14625, partial [Chloroflexi bacterium]|nr:hypothetical protein [Chloroflexota bacterium]
HRVVGQQIEDALLRRAETERRRLARHPLRMGRRGASPARCCGHGSLSVRHRERTSWSARHLS